MTKRTMLVDCDELVIGDVFDNGYKITAIEDTRDGEGVIVTSKNKNGREHTETLKPDGPLMYVRNRDEHASHVGWQCFPNDSAACYRV